MTKFIENIASFFVISLPIFLVTGPFLSDLSVILVDIFFLIIIIKEKKLNILKNKYFIFLIFLWIYFSLRSLFADDIYLSLKSSLFHLRFIILIWAISFFLDRNKKIFYIFSKVLFITIVIVCLDALLQYFYGTNILGFKQENPDKLNGLFNDEAVLGSYLIRLTPLIFAILYYFFNPEKYHFFYLFILSILGLVIFLSGSRSALFLFILFSLLFFLINLELRKLFLIYFLCLFLIVISLMQFNKKISHSVYYNLFDPFRTMFFENTSSEKKDNQKFIFTKVYDSHYKTALNMFYDNKIFGVGTKMYRILCKDKKYYLNEFSCTTHPHNFYFQLLAENGLIGFFGVLYIFIYSTLIIFKKIYIINFKEKKFINYPSLMIVIGIFINLWPVVPSGSLFNNWLSILIFFPIGFLIFFGKNKTR